MNITQLPADLVQKNILSYLSPKEVCNLRLVSQGMKRIVDVEKTEIPARAAALKQTSEQLGSTTSLFRYSGLREADKLFNECLNKPCGEELPPVLIDSTPSLVKNNDDTVFKITCGVFLLLSVLALLKSVSLGLYYQYPAIYNLLNS